MPSVTAIPSQVQKPQSASDSENSSQVVVSNKEETEEDILNKIQTEPMEVVEENLDSHTEDSILNEEKAKNHQQASDKEEINVVINNLDDHYENGDADDVGEFKSLYEKDEEKTPKIEEMEETAEEPVVQEISTKSAPMEASNNEEESTTAAVEPTNEQLEEESTTTNVEPTDEELGEEESTTANVEPTVPMPIKEEPIELDPDNIADEAADLDKTKVSEETATDKEDEADLLNVSMVRETKEDDACAIAEAMDDNKENQRSDEDQSEKTDNSDGQDEENSNGSGIVVADEDMDAENGTEIIAEASKENSNDNKEAEEEVVVDREGIVDKENNSVVIDDDEDSDKTIEICDDKHKTCKRTLSLQEIDKLTAKKPKLVDGASNKENEAETQVSVEAPKPPAYKPETLTSFANFMKCRKIAKKLTRSDLEEMCIQKICETLALKSVNGELNDLVKKHEETLLLLRKDMNQLTKQYKDLDIVHKKLLTELKIQKEINFQKPLVPLKITRSVGLQVRLTPGQEATQNRRRQPQKQILSPLGQQVVKKVAQQPAPVRQVLTSPQKPAPKVINNAPMLSQALQKQRPNQKPSPIKKPGETMPTNPGVIDLTDEDDKRTAGTNGIKFRTVPAAGTRIVSNGKSLLNQNNKLPSALPQGLRLAPSMITSATTSSAPMLYVVPTMTSNAGGQQKVAFVNFQPTNSVISGAVLNKQGQSLTIKNIATTNTVSSASRAKHPAPLPVAPIKINPNSKIKLKLTLPKPMLTIKKLDNGIILQWKMPYNLDLYEKIASYQLYAYQETTSLPSTDMWRKVGDVKALALPMACTLTQFADKNKYYFAVRAVDVFQRIGAFSDPEEISL